jgi:hypothetical protein
VIDIFVKGIEKKIFEEEYNLSVSLSKSSGIEIYQYRSSVSLTPNFGPLVKLNMTCVNISEDALFSKLIVKRVSGQTYKAHFWLGLILTLLTLLIVIYKISRDGISESLEFLIMPMFFLLYLLIIEFSSIRIKEKLRRGVERILSKEGIRFEKL